MEVTVVMIQMVTIRNQMMKNSDSIRYSRESTCFETNTSREWFLYWWRLCRLFLPLDLFLCYFLPVVLFLCFFLPLALFRFYLLPVVIFSICLLSFINRVLITCLFNSRIYSSTDFYRMLSFLLQTLLRGVGLAAYFEITWVYNPSSWERSTCTETISYFEITSDFTCSSREFPTSSETTSGFISTPRKLSIFFYSTCSFRKLSDWS